MSRDNALKLFYRAALFCGAFPLLVGIAIFLLWLLTAWSWLMAAGFFTLYGGMVFLAAGFFFLAVYGLRAFRDSELPRRRISARVLGASALLLLNLPAAAGILAAVVAIETRYTVEVRNASEKPLEKIRLFGGGIDQSLGTLPPGRKTETSFWFQKDGMLRFSASWENKKLEMVVEDYVSHNTGGGAKITAGPGGSLSVRRIHPPAPGAPD